VAVTGVDVLWTVLARRSGARPITDRLSAPAWRVALADRPAPAASSAAAVPADPDGRPRLAGLLAHDDWTAENWARRRRSLDS
jgi:hypothetical protein